MLYRTTKNYVQNSKYRQKLHKLNIGERDLSEQASYWCSEVGTFWTLLSIVILSVAADTTPVCSLLPFNSSISHEATSGYNQNPYLRHWT